MFKFLNFCASLFICYHLFESLGGMNRGFEIAADTGNYSMLIYKATYSLIYTVLQIGIYVTVFSGTEVYVTQENIAEDKE